jgi:hypothetical protein
LDLRASCSPDAKQEVSRLPARLCEEAANVAEDRGFYEKFLSKDFVIVGDNPLIRTSPDSRAGASRA